MTETIYRNLKQRVLEIIERLGQTWGDEIFHEMGYTSWDIYSKRNMWKIIRELINENKVKEWKESHHLRFLTPYNKELIVRFKK